MHERCDENIRHAHQKIRTRKYFKRVTDTVQKRCLREQQQKSQQWIAQGEAAENGIQKTDNNLKYIIIAFVGHVTFRVEKEWKF